MSGCSPGCISLQRLGAMKGAVQGAVSSVGSAWLKSLSLLHSCNWLCKTSFGNSLSRIPCASPCVCSPSLHLPANQVQGSSCLTGFLLEEISSGKMGVKAFSQSSPVSQLALSYSQLGFVGFQATCAARFFYQSNFPCCNS